MTEAPGDRSAQAAAGAGAGRPPRPQADDGRAGSA